MEAQSHAGIMGELVDQLFRTHLKADGSEYSYMEVAHALGGAVDSTYIGKLRAGKVPNPGRNVLKLLCVFFRVSPLYFFPELDALALGETDSPEAREQHLHTALRAAGLSSAAQKHIYGLIMLLSQRHDAVNE